MALFSKKKELSKEEFHCSCESKDNKKNTARFIVLGACCQKSAETFENTKTAVKELGFDDEVINLGDALEIASYGVMRTPALVVDGKVVAMGKFLTVAEIKKILSKLDIH